MRFFAEQSDPLAFAKRLTGMHLYRFRIGDYRVLFEIEGNVIKVVTIKKRDEAYRKIGLD